MKRIILVTIVLFAVVLAIENADVKILTKSSAKTITEKINYQGFLTDNLGNPINNPSLSITFKIYDDEIAGSVQWEATKFVSVEEGVFSTILDVPSNVFTAGAPRWLELTIGGNILTPRTELTAVGYSYKTIDADKLQGNTLSDLDTRYGYAGSAFLPLAGGTMTGPITSTGDPSITMGKGNFGSGNINTGTQAFVAGSYNRVRGAYSVVSGGGGPSGADSNSALGDWSTVSGGFRNSAGGQVTTIGGGYNNSAFGWYATIGGGYNNSANGYSATIGGGHDNSASNPYATIGGGRYNSASGLHATVGGGVFNSASGWYATVAGGNGDTSEADYSFTTNYASKVPSDFIYSSAFNGTTATAASQLRCGTLVANSKSFQIDHPLDPNGKFLNHFSVESPIMLVTYDGVAFIGSDGKVIVNLPDYFSALTQNPRIQLTGVGSPDVVYVAEKINGNSFVIGGKPGMEVYWQVTAERKDVSAEITKILMPVEQEKTGKLRGVSADDNYLATTMSQLQKMGYGNKFNFRTTSGQQKYENSKRIIEKEIERMK